MMSGEQLPYISISKNIQLFFLYLPTKTFLPLSIFLFFSDIQIKKNPQKNKINKWIRKQIAKKFQVTHIHKTQHKAFKPLETLQKIHLSEYKHLSLPKIVSWDLSPHRYFAVEKTKDGEMDSTLGGKQEIEERRERQEKVLLEEWGRWITRNEIREEIEREKQKRM